MKYISAVFVFVLLFSTFSMTAEAASSDIKVSGWIPYWSVSKGTRDAARNIETLDTIHPFVYSVTKDGSLKDLGDLKKSSWKKLFKTAASEDVEVIPTVMWSDGPAIHRVLSDAKLREKHIDAIVHMVEKGKYDGVDIDYEAKLASTKDNFSLFLKELNAKLGSKILTCAIEARTPPESLYRTIPANLQYANDYKAIGTHCDRVAIMAYDQRRADILLNDAKAGEPYIPVSDIDWVRKTLTVAVAAIPKEKLMLGVPTYGHEYTVTVAPNWYRDYTRVGALNPKAAEDIADDENAKPSRNRGGEMSFSYRNEDTPRLPSSLTIPNGTSSGNIIAARALAYANKTGKTITFNYVTWSDAETVERKAALAREFGIRGIAIFKIDGEEDRDIWDVLR